ncbi:MAG: BCCT family transporter [Deltaproteobacteria bacterium]|jgi:BCCT family betaine/carnitine transporter|nr:BCCT family transporter [Deltaproteobacteria bacterium]
MAEDKLEKGSGRIDYRVFIPSILIILAVAIPLSIDAKLGYEMVTASFGFVTKYFGWLAMLIPPACLIFLLWLSFGPYGNVKLGNPEDKPEYSTFSWVAMLFCCGIGSSIIIWGVAEPIYYIDGPPLNLEPRSIAAYGIAHALPTYHWGIHGWAIYTVGTLAVTYSIYVRKAPRLRLSTSCEPLLGEKRVKSGWGAAIEILVVIGTVGGFGTSLGLGVPFISTFVAQLFNVPDTVGVKAGVLIVWTCIFAFSAYRGLNRGILLLSNINVVLVLLVLVFILVCGPTLFIIDLSVNSLYTMFSNFISLSFSMEPFILAQDPVTGVFSRGQGFPQWWPIFYWFWFIALMPITAIFIARISRGRTIRQVALGTVIWASLGCFIILSILGGYSLFLQYTGELDVAAILAKNSPGSTAATVLFHLPFAKFMTPLYIIMSMVFLATTLDSASYALASICTYELKGDQQPKRSLRLLWALVLGIFSVGLLVTSGEGALRTIQTSSVVLGLPLIIACFGLALSLVVALKKDFPELTVPKIAKDLSAPASKE